MNMPWKTLPQNLLGGKEDSLDCRSSAYHFGRFRNRQTTNDLSVPDDQFRHGVDTQQQTHATTTSIRSPS
jgi:hypothetical protein